MIEEIHTIRTGSALLVVDDNATLLGTLPAAGNGLVVVDAHGPNGARARIGVTHSESDGIALLLRFLGMCTCTPMADFYVSRHMPDGTPVYRHLFEPWTAIPVDVIS